jgi:2-iminobutanoate/2-iminopropanoate deaminase
MNRAIVTDGAPAAIGPYAQAVERDGWLFLSGQIALDPGTGELVSGDVADQARRVLLNLASVMEAAGGSLADVVKTTVYMVDLADFAAMNEVYADHFGDAPPARVCVEIAALPKGAVVEIDAVARLPRD